MPTLWETDMVLRGLTIGKKPLKDHMEAVGHKEAFYFVHDFSKGAGSFIRKRNKTDPLSGSC